MNKKRLSTILTIFFLVQGISVPSSISAETLLLNPPTRVSLNESQFSIKPLCETICAGLFIYKMDAKKRYSKKRISREFGAFLSRSTNVQFDIDQIDLGKKLTRKHDRTRYYPFSVDGKQFILRIFLYSERFYQKDLPVLYEACTKDQKLMLQILPGVSELVKECKVEPHNLLFESPVSRSP